MKDFIKFVKEAIVPVAEKFVAGIVSLVCIIFFGRGLMNLVDGTENVGPSVGCIIFSVVLFIMFVRTIKKR